MSRLRHVASCLALVFVGVWAETIAFNIKFADLPILLGPAIAFTCFAGGIAALFGALWFSILACGEDDA